MARLEQDRRATAGSAERRLFARMDTARCVKPTVISRPVHRRLLRRVRLTARLVSRPCASSRPVILRAAAGPGAGEESLQVAGLGVQAVALSRVTDVRGGCPPGGAGRLQPRQPGHRRHSVGSGRASSGFHAVPSWAFWSGLARDRGIGMRAFSGGCRRGRGTGRLSSGRGVMPVADAAGGVAVSCGRCAGSCSAAAVGGACMVQFRRAGCGQFRAHVSRLPGPAAFLEDLPRARERLAAAGTDQIPVTQFAHAGGSASIGVTRPVRRRP